MMSIIYNMPLLTVALIWLLAAVQCVQVHSEAHAMTYKPNVFDDQYIGCSDKMEKDMQKVLQKEKANKQFKEAWINATDHWEEIKDGLSLPEGFEDEYGIALLTFTNKYPEGNPIYRQLNGNLTIAGASRKDYMEKFHFKALHFYLTRALQVLKPNCDLNYTTYRGSPHSFHVRPLFKFGRFTSSSLKFEEALVFGTQSLFVITTCFGAKVGHLSFFPSEEEVLIPPTEKFLYDRKENSWYYLRSTGEMCSYFNCAYLGGEKRKYPVCRSDATQPIEETVDGDQPDMMSASELEERISVLEDHISQNHLYWNQYRSELETIMKLFFDNGNETSVLYSLKKMTNQTMDISNLTASNLEMVTRDVRDIIGLVADHQRKLKTLQNALMEQKAQTEMTLSKVADTMLEVFKTMKKELRHQQDMIQSLVLVLVTSGVIGASILFYIFWMRKPAIP